MKEKQNARVKTFTFHIKCQGAWQYIY